MIDFSIEKKYVDLVGSNIKRQTDKYIQISCPICGEGNSKYKARGFVLKNEGDSFAIYTCHNECGNMKFSEMLGSVNKQLESSYIQEVKKQHMKDFRPKKSGLDIFQKKDKNQIQISSSSIPRKIVLFEEVVQVEELTKEAREYLKGRKIIESEWKYFRSVPERNAIVAFMYKDSEEVIGWQVRLMDQKVFSNHMVDDSPKIWGLDKLIELPKRSRIYLFEAIFDAMSVDLVSLAIIGGDISKELLEELFSDYEVVFCYDNDETGVKKSIKYSAMGYSCLVHDESFPVKDMNKALELSKGDIMETRKKLSQYIENNIMKPKMANMKLRLKKH